MAEINPYAGQYKCPDIVLIRSIPLMSSERKEAIIDRWCTVRPTRKIESLVYWYEENDSEVISLSRILVTLAPLILSYLGTDITGIITFATIGIFTTEYFSRLQSEKRLERHQNEIIRKIS